MPEISATSVLSVLRSTEVLPPQRIAELEREFGGGESPQALAAHLVKTGELTAWQAKLLLSGRDDLRIGKYILRERLSQNELGDRMLAMHYNLDRMVDLQILPASAQSQTPEFEDFLRQASELARLSHDNLIHVYDIDRDRGRYYLVCEHFEANTLDQVVQSDSFALTELASVTCQFLRGLQYAHQFQVIHGHIGLDSLLVSADRVAKVGNLAVLPLRQAFGHLPSVSSGEFSMQPADDYIRCVRLVLSSLKVLTGQVATISRQEFEAIVRPLASSATEAQVEETLGKLDRWLEKYRPNELSSDSSISLAAVAVLVPPQPVTPVPPKPVAKPVPRKRRAALPLGRIAAAISLGGLALFAAWKLLLTEKPPSRESIAAAKAAQKTADRMAELRNTQQRRRTPQSTADSEKTSGVPSLESWKPRPRVAPQKPADAKPSEMNLDPLLSEDGSNPTPAPALDPTTTFRLPEPSTVSVPANTNTDPAAGSLPRRLGHQVGRYNPSTGSESAPAQSTPEIPQPSLTENMPAPTAPVPTQSPPRHRIQRPPAPPVPGGTADDDVRKNQVETAPQDAPQAADAMPNQEMPGTKSDSAPPDPNAAPAGEDSATNNDVATSPFAATPPSADLPSVDVTTEVVLGQVHSGDKYLLACSLACDDRVTRRTKFSLEKVAGDQSQSWTVIGDTSSAEPARIAQIALAGTELKFRWEPEAARDPSFGYLRNCLLRMQVGTETFLLRLRKPVAMGTAKVSAVEPQAQLRFELESFPFDDGLVVAEFLEIADVQFSDDQDDFSFFVEPADQVIPLRDPLYVYMTERSERYVYLELEAKISKKSELTATVRIHQEPKPRTYSEKLMGEAESYLQRVASEVAQTYAQAREYVAPYGQKTKHEERVKELKKLTERSNENIVDFSLQKRRLAAIFSKPIRVRLYYTVGDEQIELATWDGQPTPKK